MTEKERNREKELKYLIYLKSQLIKEAKKDIKTYHEELESLGKSKVKRRGKYEDS